MPEAGAVQEHVRQLPGLKLPPPEPAPGPRAQSVVVRPKRGVARRRPPHAWQLRKFRRDEERSIRCASRERLRPSTHLWPGRHAGEASSGGRNLR